MIRLINYEDKYQDDFKRLNLEWLDKYNLTESHDLEVLDDPQKFVNNKSGWFFLEMDDDKVLATGGFSKENDTEYELVKMFVDEAYRGKGISKTLLDRCLEEAKKLHAHKVILYSNSQLKTALKLYEKYGFNYVDASNAPFLTADIKMELSLTTN